MSMYYCGKPGCPGHDTFDIKCPPTARDYSNYRYPVLVTFVLDTFESDPFDESGPISQPHSWQIEGEDYSKPASGNGNGHSNGNGDGNGHSSNGNGHSNGNGNGHSNENGEYRNWAVEAESRKPANGNGHSTVAGYPTKMKANLGYKLKNLRDKKRVGS